MIYSDHASKFSLFHAHEFMASLDPTNGVLLVRDVADPRNHFIVEPTDNSHVIEFRGRCEVKFHRGTVKQATRGIQIILPPRGMQFVVRDVMDYALSADAWDSFFVLHRNEWITVKEISR